MTKISGEEQFQVLAHSFAVSPSSEGYTLQYSADGIHFSDWPQATPADDTLVVTNVARLMFFRLKGNGSDVIITY